jgi:limonene-1,2-epoxide hydrolase
MTTESQEERPAPHPNEELLRTFYGALERGDQGSIAQLLGDDIVVHNPLTGTYEGREHVMAMYRRFAELVGPTFKFPALDVLANESSIVVLPAVAGWRTARKGMDVYHVDRGQIVEIWISEWDTSE